MMARYRPYAAAYAALHRRQAAAVEPQMVPARVVENLITAWCASGQHKPETDEVTGNEVCRWCGTVTDDYSDVAEYLQRVREGDSLQSGGEEEESA